MFDAGSGDHFGWRVSSRDVFQSCLKNRVGWHCHTLPVSGRAFHSSWRRFRSADGLESGMPIEAVLVDLRDALLELERVLGIDADDAVLDRIFATFCVGK